MKTGERNLIVTCGTILATLMLLVPLAGRGTFGPAFPNTAMAIGAATTLGLLTIVSFAALRHGRVRRPMLAIGLGLAVVVAALTVAVAAKISAAF